MAFPRVALTRAPAHLPLGGYPTDALLKQMVSVNGLQSSLPCCGARQSSGHTQALCFQRSVVTKIHAEVLAPLVGGVGAAPAVQQVHVSLPGSVSKPCSGVAWGGRPVLEEERQLRWPPHGGTVSGGRKGPAPRFQCLAGILSSGAEPGGCSPLANSQWAAKETAVQRPAESRPTRGL